MSEGKNDIPDFCFFARVLKGFLEEIEEEEKKDRETRKKDNSNFFCDMYDLCE